MSFSNSTASEATFTSTASAVAGSYGPFALTANNGISPNATQNLTITVANVAVALSCNLIKPTNGNSFAPGSTIALEATATPSTGQTISKVEFFQTPTGAVTPTLIGTGTFDGATSSYKRDWPAPSAGTYSIMARATEAVTNATADSTIPSIITVTTPTPTPTPTPATIQVRP
jgi:hypothetical protein